MKELSIAFFTLHPPERMPSYMRRDHDTLARMGQVRAMRSQPGRGWRRGLGPGGWWPSAAMLRLVRASDVVVQWFAVPSAPMVAAKLCGKPALAVAGGYEVTALPEINYGRMLHPLTRRMTQLALKLATKVVAVSRFTQEETAQWVPSVRTEVLYHGIEPELFPMGLAPDKRLRQVLTVGRVSNEYLERKGLDTFARASRALPEVPFILGGKHVDESAARRLRELGGDNLQLPGYLSDEELGELLQSSAVYAQLSLHEGFGCSVAEAMLSGCTPVVSNRGALPEVVGDTGYYVEPRDADAGAKVIAQALESPRGAQARERIETHFPAARRERELREHILSLVGRTP